MNIIDIHVHVIIHVQYIIDIQWNFHIKDTLGPGILSFIKRLSSLWRFIMYCQDMKFFIWDHYNCPLYGVSIKRGSTVIIHAYVHVHAIDYMYMYMYMYMHLTCVSVNRNTVSCPCLPAISYNFFRSSWNDS